MRYNCSDASPTCRGRQFSSLGSLTVGAWPSYPTHFLFLFWSLNVISSFEPSCIIFWLIGFVWEDCPLPMKSLQLQCCFHWNMKCLMRMSGSKYSVLNLQVKKNKYKNLYLFYLLIISIVYAVQCVIKGWGLFFLPCVLFFWETKHEEK